MKRGHFDIAVSRRVAGTEIEGLPVPLADQEMMAKVSAELYSCFGVQEEIGAQLFIFLQFSFFKTKIYVFVTLSQRRHHKRNHFTITMIIPMTGE